jgi:formylglycine-generating enzyme required for sulfatase activity
MRLPTEAEWEKAASWDPLRGEKRKYPWGDEFDKSKCNTSESGIGTTTPVGQFSPAGDSPYGCVDMAGNVCEWTSSLKKKYPYLVDDGREDESETYERSLGHLYSRRVERGGSFREDATYARTAYREGIVRTGVLDARLTMWYDLGFRCGASPAEMQNAEG